MSVKLASLPYRIDKEAIESGFLVSIPTLGSALFRATGDTEEEAFETLGSMLADLLAWMVEKGKPIPRPTADDLRAFRARVATEPKERDLGLLSIMGW